MSLTQLLESKLEHLLKIAKEKHEAELKALEDKYKVDLAEAESEYKHLVEEEIQRTVEQKKFALTKEYEFQLLTKRHKILEDLYRESMEELLKDEEYLSNFVKKFLQQTEQFLENGTIVISGQYKDQAHKVLKKMTKLPLEEKDEPQTLLRLQFISSEQIVDFDTQTLIEKAKDQTLGDLYSKLFVS